MENGTLIVYIIYIDINGNEGHCLKGTYNSYWNIQTT